MSIEIEAELQKLIKSGLTFAQCVNALGAEEGPFINAARELKQREGEVEFDDHVVISDSDEGAYVMAWVWVSNEEAGVEPEDDDDDDGDEDVKDDASQAVGCN